jgi:hypothetical protein
MGTLSRLYPTDTDLEHLVDVYGRWANYAIAVTREQSCERYAFGNPVSSLDTTCGTNLDDFVNDESLANAGIIV